MLKLIVKLDIWLQHGHFTMNSYYHKLCERHFKPGFIIMSDVCVPIIREFAFPNVVRVVGRGNNVLCIVDVFKW